MKRLATTLAIAALVAGNAVLTTDSAAAATLLSQGGSAVDGATGTRWSSAFSDPQWLRVDLGGTATISEVVLNWESAYATAYQLQVSDNASDWRTVFATTTGAGGTRTIPVSGTGRYVRLYGTQRVGGYGYSLWEFQVLGAAG